MQVRQEGPGDAASVEMLFDLCFAPGREALSSYRLRGDTAPIAPLCLLIEDHGSLAGAIRYWPVQVGGAPVLLLGPVAVHPTHQGEGLGERLIADSLARAAGLGWDRVMLIGDASYYERFGFQRLEGVDFPPPTNPDRILGLELLPGGWDGVTGAVTKPPV